MKLKMNWGTGIIIAYSIFIVLILVAVFKAVNQKIELVTPDYYAQEIDYQNKLDKKENAGTLDVPVTVIQNERNVVITFPKEATGPLSGKVIFYRASNSADDVALNLKTDESGQMVVPVSRLKKGSYSVLIDWAAGTKKYYSKVSLFVQ